jgi:hypothetical protein
MLGEDSSRTVEVSGEELLWQAGGVREFPDDLLLVGVAWFVDAGFEALKSCQGKVEACGEGLSADAGVCACGADTSSEVGHGISLCR